MKNDERTAEETLAGGGRSLVIRRGNQVIREFFPWTPSVHAVLRHLESKGFSGSPRVISSRNEEEDIQTYIEGINQHISPWSDDQIVCVASLLHEFHSSMRDFIAPEEAIWRPWFARDIYDDDLIIGHCDFSPWNILTRQDVPVAIIDWETAGPVSRLVEIAHACWINVQLVDDDVAERAGLPPLSKRLQQLRLFCDAYGIGTEERKRLPDIMVKIAILDAADQAIEAKISVDSTDVTPLWGLAWRTRSAAWMVRHYAEIQRALS